MCYSFGRNVKQQLQDRKFPEQHRKVTLDEIFGSRMGTVYTEGLIDSKTCDDFNSKLSSLKPVWEERESSDASCTKGFHDWFLQHKAEVFKCSAICSVPGLGNPPELFTTNASESLNSVLKSKVNYEKSELNKFIGKMKCLVDDQQREVERAVCRRGKYRFRSQYQFLEVDAVLECIWKKSTEIITSQHKIAPAPGCSPLARMVESKPGKRPHLVTAGKGGKYFCNSDCANYKAFNICSHVVAAAENNHLLSSFIDYFKRKVPNLSSLAKAGMPTGRGRKGGEPPRKRKKAEDPETRIPFGGQTQLPRQTGFHS